MNELRERAKEDWGVEAEPLIKAVEAAIRHREYWAAQKPLIDSAEPAECAHRLRQAHKGIAALPLRARAHLHWSLAERLAYGPCGLDSKQIRALMEDTNLVTLLLDALGDPMDTERKDQPQELRWLVQAWVKAGGEVSIDGRYDGDLIEFLSTAYRHLGDARSDDAIRRGLDRIRRLPPKTEG